MSFTNFDVDLESQTPFSDSPEFDTKASIASNILLDLNNSVVTLHKFITALGMKTSLNGTEQLNLKTVKLSESITSDFKKLGDVVKALNGFDELNPAQQFTKERIQTELKEKLDEFQELQLSLKSITDKLNTAAKTALYEEQTQAKSSESAVRQQSQSQSQLILEEDIINNEEFTYQQNLIRERDQEIAQIQSGIEELNEIFQDLGHIVQEQGTMVDNIESNIYRVSGAMKGAEGELRKAKRYQERSKGRSLCFLAVLCALLTVVILGIFL